MRRTNILNERRKCLMGGVAREEHVRIEVTPRSWHDGTLVVRNKKKATCDRRN
jgi:hypothetical protein